MSRFIANADYEETDTNPIRLQPGDRVRAGGRDRTWPGWLWVSDGAGNDGYVPEELLEPCGEGLFVANAGFDPTVLKLRRGDGLLSLRQVHGWHWCRTDAGNEGWVAGYLLTPA